MICVLFKLLLIAHFVFFSLQIWQTSSDSSSGVELLYYFRLKMNASSLLAFERANQTEIHSHQKHFRKMSNKKNWKKMNLEYSCTQREKKREGKGDKDREREYDACIRCTWRLSHVRWLSTKYTYMHMQCMYMHMQWLQAKLTCLILIDYRLCQPLSKMVQHTQTHTQVWWYDRERRLSLSLSLLPSKEKKEVTFHRFFYLFLFLFFFCLFFFSFMFSFFFFYVLRLFWQCRLLSHYLLIIVASSSTHLPTSSSPS